MNFSVNNTSFQGKTEVIYGLKQAAKNSRSAEFCRAVSMGTRPINKINEQQQYNAVMKAYLDMSVNDSSFAKTISELVNETSSKDFIEIKETLKPEVMQFSKTNPIGEFRRWMRSFVEKNEIKVDKSLIDDFISKLEA